MTSPTTHSQTLKRKVDDGGPLALWKVQRDDGTAEGVAVHSKMCSNPDCRCQEIGLRGYPLEITKMGELVASKEVAFSAALNLSTGELLKAEDAEKPIPEWIVSELTGPKLEVFRERRERYRRSQRSREQQRELPQLDQDQLTGGVMTGYFEVFPDEWDLVAGLDGRSFWAFDSYCMNPSCRCRDILVQFHDSVTGDLHGTARVELGKWKRPTFEGSEEMPRLWRAFIARKGTQQALKQRYRDMREASAEMARAHPPSKKPPATQRQPEGKVGRNQPCPCGSGRKYKRCCGKL